MKISQFQVVIAILLSTSSGIANAQLANSNAIPLPVSKPTSNAEALGKYGNFPVGFYAGQPVINIPLYTVNYGDITIPISLSYDASGIKVDQYPSWVGLGFSLHCGGVITRSVHGMPDDYMHPEMSNEYAGTENGYLFCGNKLNLAGQTWYSPQTLESWAYYYQNGSWNPTYLADGCPDDFSFNVGGYSGAFFLDETGTWRVKSKSNLGLEVSHEVNTSLFNFETCGVNMYIKKLITKFIIKTPDGFEYTFGGDAFSMDFSRGVQDDLNLNANNPLYYNISPTAWYLTKIKTPQAQEILLTYERGLNLIRHNRSVTAVNYDPGGFTNNNMTNSIGFYSSILTPCYLKKIETPDQKLEFLRSYTTEQMYSSAGVLWETENGGMSLANFEAQMFDVSPPTNPQDLYRGWLDFVCEKYNSINNSRPLPGNQQGTRIPNYAYKLDSIEVYDKRTNAKARNVGFNYSNSESLRLFLYNVTTTTSNTAPAVYSFDYINPELVPNYNVLTKDQWGYNNGINYAQAANKYDPVHGRLPNEGLTKNGTLQKITFPTGGTTEFEYELNDYSKYQKVNLVGGTGTTGSTSLESVANTNAGGLRIKKISSSANYNAPIVTKEYFYRKNYATNGQESSGILSGINQYVDAFAFNNPCTGGIGFSQTCSDNAFQRWGENDIKTITYSEVTEKNSDGSFTVYKYSNYETPDCLDEVHLPAFIFGAIISYVYQLTSNEIERGLLLEEVNYNNLNVKVSEKIYEYDYDPDRKQKFAKCVRRYDNLKTTQDPANFWLLFASPCYEQAMLRLYPYKKYYYNIPLKKITDRTFETSGTIAQETSFQYDQYGNKTSTVIKTSDGKLLTSSVKFNSHSDYLNPALGSSAIGLKRLFTDYHIKNYPVEQLTVTTNLTSGGGIQLWSDKIIDGSIAIFDENRPVVKSIFKLEPTEPIVIATPNGLGQPVYNFDFSKISSGNFTIDSRYKLQQQVNGYTAYPPGIVAKPLSVTSTTGRSTYTWDHLARYQTSTTTNADANEVAFISFEGSYTTSGADDDNKGNWLFSPVDITVEGFTGYYSINLAAGNYLSTKNTLGSSKKFILEFWAKGNTPKIKLGGTVIPVSYAASKQSGDWNFYSIPITGTGEQLSLTCGSGGNISTHFDEVRLYPVGGLMNSYNYDRLTGNVISVTDANGLTTFYSYDFMGRLITVTDEQRHIIKNHNYQIQGPQ